MKATPIIQMNCTIGEGPVWDSDSKKLYFVDVREWKLYSWNGKEIDNTTSFNKNLGFAIPRRKGGFLVGLRDGFYFADFGCSEPQFIKSPEPGRTDGRFNDGKADPAGRVWGGTQSVRLDSGEGKPTPDSGLYCLDDGLEVKCMLDDVIQGNGMGWTADTKKFYFIDTERFCVQEFDYDIENNALTNGRVCVEIPNENGIPDGMTVDDEGNIWVALWGGHAVNKYDPSTGALLDKVEMPVPNVTSCCFGGEHLDELYITTAAINTDMDRYPLAGSVFVADPGVTGRPSYKFIG